MCWERILNDSECNSLFIFYMNSKKLKWKTDFDKEVVIENFIRRGWTKADKD